MQQLTTPRELRGLAILSQPETIIPVSKNEWDVRSQSKDAYYRVIRKFVSNSKTDHYSWSCSCPDFTTHNAPCKHIYAVQFSQKIRSDVEQNATPEQIKSVEQQVSCPKCKSEIVVKSGIRKTDFGTVQRFECKSCGLRFVVDKGFSRMKHDPTLITLTLDLYFKGLSNRKIQDHIVQFHKLKIAHTTILRWIKKYLCALGKYTEKNKVNTGNIWHSDETTVFIKKDDEKRHYEWIWNVMDAKTRYLLACQVTEERFVKDARKALKQAKDTASVRPDAIVTDGLQAYKEAVKAEFYDKSAFVQNPHIRLKDFETKPNNNILERLNGTFRERTKIMRSFDSSMGAGEFAAGMQTYYNYIRPHQGIGGLTPAQMAGIEIDLTGNRWMKMIEMTVK
jgi:transposase-like protein/DNA-directed RNA polymerase subunit M/transcription elongation factor TFIIS